MKLRIFGLISIAFLSLSPLGNYFNKGNLETFNNYYDNLSPKEYDWYYESRVKGEPPFPPKETKDFINNYDVFYLGDTSKKELYLTFDEGYENGYTAKILDTLKKHDVKAAFFVVAPYIKTNKDLIKRMAEEGHLVCNHSANHPSMAKVPNREDFQKELKIVEELYKEATGKEIAKFFRPPMGKYSELSLNLTSELGYKTIFWSFAYMDWIPEQQPSRDMALNKILSRTHNGAIVLLHAVSKTNAEILDELISKWKEAGYEIKSLEDLPKSN